MNIETPKLSISFRDSLLFWHKEQNLPYGQKKENKVILQKQMQIQFCQQEKNDRRRVESDMFQTSRLFNVIFTQFMTL